MSLTNIGDLGTVKRATYKATIYCSFANSPSTLTMERWAKSLDDLIIEINAVIKDCRENERLDAVTSIQIAYEEWADVTEYFREK